MLGKKTSDFHPALILHLPNRKSKKERWPIRFLKQESASKTKQAFFNSQTLQVTFKLTTTLAHSAEHDIISFKT